MTKQTEALKLALEALESCNAGDYSTGHVIHPSFDEDAVKDAITAIREALAEDSSGTEQPVPVAWFPPYPPPECKSEAEKTAFAFGWYEALEAQRAFDKKAENARELGLDYEPTQPHQEPDAYNRKLRAQLEQEWIELLKLRKAEQPAQQEPVAWRDHVEQRLLTWRQSFVNKSGDQLALDDFMDKRSLDDLIDFVCSEYTSPPAQQQEPLTWKDEQGNVRMTLDAGGIQSSVGYVYSVHGERIKNACIRSDIPNGTPLYTSPPASKPWVGLTQQDIDIAFDDTQEGGGFDDFARAIEAKLKEKNT